MKEPALDPDVADVAPNESVLTTYDEQHLVTYWRLLDAEAAGPGCSSRVAGRDENC